MLALSAMIDPDCRDPPKTFSWWLIDVIFFTLCNSFFNVGGDGGLLLFFFYREVQGFIFILKIFIGVRLIYNVVLVSAIPSESVIHVLS